MSKHWLAPRNGSTLAVGLTPLGDGSDSAEVEAKAGSILEMLSAAATAPRPSVRALPAARRALAAAALARFTACSDFFEPGQCCSAIFISFSLNSGVS